MILSGCSSLERRPTNDYISGMRPDCQNANIQLVYLQRLLDTEPPYSTIDNNRMSTAYIKDLMWSIRIDCRRR